MKSRKPKNWRLKPDPIIADITPGVVELASAALDRDLAGIVAGTADLKDMETPSIHEAELFLTVILENADEFDVSSWPAGYFKPIMAGILARFLMDVAQAPSIQKSNNK